jgi:hypothetical protein
MPYENKKRVFIRAEKIKIMKLTANFFKNK